MDSDKATQASSEFESALPEILPDLYQLLQQYQVSRTLEIALEPAFLDAMTMESCTCCFVNGTLKCGSGYRKSSLEALGAAEDTLGLDPAEAHQFGADVQSKLSTVLPRLSQSVKQTGETFEVHFLIDPTTEGNSNISCRFVNGVLVCSDQPQ